MAVTVKELRKWLSDIPEDEWIGIDEGGLCLVCGGKSYYEIGGEPIEEEDEDEEEKAVCVLCETEVVLQATSTGLPIQHSGHIDKTMMCGSRTWKWVKA